MFYDDIDALGTYIDECLARYPDNTFLCELDEDEVTASVTYREAKERIDGIKNILRENGIRPGDKISLLGQNSINWGLMYMAVVTYGAIIVPILHEFDSTSVSNIINMSDSRMLFISSSLLEKIESAELKKVEKVYMLDDFKELELEKISLIRSQIKNRLYDFKDWASQFLSEHVYRAAAGTKREYIPEVDDIAAIVYTSGTTGKSKGVMLTHRNIYWNILAALDYIEINGNDKFLSVLPSAHVYECTFTLLLSMVGGASVYYLKQKPSPKVLLKAFEKVKPSMVMMVPLVMEKIYKKNILPKFEGNSILRGATKITPLRRFLYKKASDALLEALGGNIKLICIGGAPLSSDVDLFLLEGKFPSAVGYGMTECAPLITFAMPDKKKYQSCGYPIKGAEIKIDNPDPVTGVGEVLVKGPMVTKGYYKNEEETRRLFTEDGWMRTGDLGYIDKDNYLYLKGRCKNVILGSSGENIYPEEIEQLLGQNRGIIEALVLDRDGKLIAYIYPDYEFLNSELKLLSIESGQAREKIEKYFDNLIKETNQRLPGFSQIRGFKLVDEEFEKTPTQK
ncbi:MAG TPA: AMP-binding protein, partial [bacterium]|nr:AMP-binding protein [bacterium]